MITTLKGIASDSDCMAVIGGDLWFFCILPLANPRMLQLQGREVLLKEGDEWRAAAWLGQSDQWRSIDFNVQEWARRLGQELPRFPTASEFLHLPHGIIIMSQF